MDSDLLSALIGLGGGLVGVAVGGYLQQRVTHAQQSRQTTLELYERLDDPDILDSRIRADRLLSENAASAEPKSLAQLYSALPREDWQHISRTRHFLDQIGLLQRIGYLDPKIAAPLFTKFIDYWTTRHFAPLEEMEAARGHAKSPTQPWQVTSRELQDLFKPTR